MDDISTQSIDAANSGNWKLAIDLNLKALKTSPKDVDSLNRLARAYYETAQKTKSEEIYKKVLKLDKFNSIATKNLNLLLTSRIDRSTKHTSGSPPPAFIEEPGITRTITLVRLGDPKIVARLHPGDQVKVIAREHSVCVISLENEHLGRLPDDLASRLLPLLKGGNIYHCWIKSNEDAVVKVFIKEISKSPNLKSIISFPSFEKLTYAAFTPPELVHQEKPDTNTFEESNDSDKGSDDNDSSEE